MTEQEAWDEFKRERPDLFDDNLKLSELQQAFTYADALLRLHAHSLGYGLTLGRGYASEAANAADGGHRRSLHLYRLAQDYNIFKDGEYLQGEAAEKAHNELHDYWDKLGGAGRIPRDLNHYSFAYGGMR